MKSLTKEEGAVVLEFLREAQDRLEINVGDLPFKAVEGHLVINWLRGRLDRKLAKVS
jgi:hypothetical protein